MASRTGSTAWVLGIVVAVGLMVVGNATAQQPAPPSGPLPSPAVTLPPIPTAPPVMAVVPSVRQSTSPYGGPIEGPPVQPAGGFGVTGFQSGSPVVTPTPSVRHFTFEPNTPVKDLLPTPPPVKPAGPVLTDDLTKVPEAEFQARPEKVAADGKQSEQTAHQLAKINHANARKTDAFMVALLASREDLAGLPFVMSDDCRTSGERSKQFTLAVATVRSALASQGAAHQMNASLTQQLPGQPAGGGGFVPFWQQYVAHCEQQDAARSRSDKAMTESVTLARIAALTQMLAAESPDLRLGLVKYLTAIPHVEATKALARMAIFSTEDDVRLAAIDSLKVRREKDYTDILLKGLQYPWPAVAKRSADAIARMGRSDLIPELVAVLAANDPRMPTSKMVDGKSIVVVREMVKVNHHRNCVMCHAPGNPGTTSTSAITVEVPVQGQPLPLPTEGYRQSSPDLMIRVDVTYLRQDFSAMLTVGDAHPWPELQRFDFLVRERKLTPREAEDYRVKLTPKEAGVLSPYHRAALAALRELTGKDTAPTAEAWRELLDLSANSR